MAAREVAIGRGPPGHDTIWVTRGISVARAGTAGGGNLPVRGRVEGRPRSWCMLHMTGQDGAAMAALSYLFRKTYLVLDNLNTDLAAAGDDTRIQQHITALHQLLDDIEQKALYVRVPRERQRGDEFGTIKVGDAVYCVDNVGRRLDDVALDLPDREHGLLADVLARTRRHLVSVIDARFIRAGEIVEGFNPDAPSPIEDCKMDRLLVGRTALDLTRHPMTVGQVRRTACELGLVPDWERYGGAHAWLYEETPNDLIVPHSRHWADSFGPHFRWCGPMGSFLADIGYGVWASRASGQDSVAAMQTAYEVHGHLDRYQGHTRDIVHVMMTYLEDTLRRDAQGNLDVTSLPTFNDVLICLRTHQAECTVNWSEPGISNAAFRGEINRALSHHDVWNDETQAYEGILSRVRPRRRLARCGMRAWWGPL